MQAVLDNTKFLLGLGLFIPLYMISFIYVWITDGTPDFGKALSTPLMKISWRLIFLGMIGFAVYTCGG